MAISVKLEAFEGPLDLLLHLIEKNKIDIYDIPIVEITAQYLDYIKQMRREDMNVMSEFLVMAATLIDIKCKMLLPKEVNEDGEEEDPRAELVQKLLEYKMYKYMSFELRDRQVMLYVEAYAREHKTFSFRKLLEKQNSKMEVIVTFLIILELMKTGKINISQENIFDDIMITSNV